MFNDKEYTQDSTKQPTLSVKGRIVKKRNVYLKTEEKKHGNLLDYDQDRSQQQI